MLKPESTTLLVRAFFSTLLYCLFMIFWLAFVNLSVNECNYSANMYR